MFTKAILAAVLATAVSASIPALEPRQNIDLSSFGPECQSAIAGILPLYNEIPTPPADLVNSIPTDPCVAPSLPPAQEGEYSSYIGAVEQWYQSHSSALNAALASCPQLASYANQVPICTKGSTYPTGGSAPYPTATGAPAPGGTDVPPTTTNSGTLPTAAAAAPQSGLVAAAFGVGAAVIGVLAL